MRETQKGAKSKRGEKLERIGEAIASGGLSLVGGRPNSPSLEQSHEEKSPPIALTEGVMKERFGFELAVYFPRWQTDAAGVIEFHEELDRLGKEFGWENVIGTLYQDSESDLLLLGVFVKPRVAE